MTADDIRKRIVATSIANGGHLASSLGAVEISMALTHVFDPIKDRIVWDVGHQAYAWKLLTGREAEFASLRRFGGISGFPNPSESPADAATAGHAGVAISVAEGYAAARDLKGTNENVIAVVGDGAIANGTSFEALNNCAGATRKVIVILNDNEMSISRPTGALARFLGRMISGVGYNRVKAAAESAGHRLHLTFLREIYHRMESRAKSWVLGNAFFEQFGLRYIGPIDGHNLSALESAFTVAREDKRSVLVHVITKKGFGYGPAEEDPTAWHGISAGGVSKEKKARTWSDAFGEALLDLARDDDRIVALTAGMKDGTGLNQFAAEFPRRFYDVGIAEGHATAFAAGLAAGGMKPVVAIYSTFLQRAVDQVMHDVCISSRPVVFCVDRAGVVGADGVTHQGLYDFAMLKSLPNLKIVQPKDEEDLKVLLAEALNRNGPTVIRYPRGNVPQKMEIGKANEKSKFALWVTPDWLAKANEIAKRVPVEIVCVRSLKPFESEILADQRHRGLKIVSLENMAKSGGLGEFIGADICLGWPDEFIPHGSVGELEKAYGLDVESIISTLSSENMV